jgi:hypothetical protein
MGEVAMGVGCVGLVGMEIGVEEDGMVDAVEVAEVVVEVEALGVGGAAAIGEHKLSVDFARLSARTAVAVGSRSLTKRGFDAQ